MFCPDNGCCVTIDRTAGLAMLTPFERDVLALSATGMTLAEIAAELGESPIAVRQSVTSSIAKLGARSKLEAIILAVRQGLIRHPPGRTFTV